MKKKVLFMIALFIVSGVFFSVHAMQEKVQTTETIYTVDNQSFILFADKATIDYEKGNIDDKANHLMEALEASVNFSMQDDGLFPNVKNGITVHVDKKTAIVNFSKDFVENHCGGTLSEKMTIYSIVNTLTSLPEINKVNFLVNGKKDGELCGHMDLNLTYTFSPQFNCSSDDE